MHETPSIISYRQGDSYLLLRTQPDAQQQTNIDTARLLHIHYSCTAHVLELDNGACVVTLPSRGTMILRANTWSHFLPIIEVGSNHVASVRI